MELPIGLLVFSTSLPELGNIASRFAMLSEVLPGEPPGHRSPTMFILLAMAGCEWLAADPLDVPYEERDLSIDSRLTPVSGVVALPGERGAAAAEAEGETKRWSPVRKPINGESLDAGRSQPPLIKLNQPGAVMVSDQPADRR